MDYFLAPQAVLKWLEKPCVYQIAKDELYELDDASIMFLRSCMSDSGCNTKDSAFVDYCIEEGIITTENKPVRRPPLTKSPEPSLRYLELQITSACNLRCKHCYIGNGRAEELSARQVRSILKEFDDMQGLRVMISGGEPLLHKEFLKINEMLPEFLTRKILFTNGLMLTDKILKRLNVQEIQVSLDGLERAHESLRGAGTFEPAMDAVRRGLDFGFDVSVATMVHRGNLDDFDPMERMFKRMKIKDWTVDVPCSVGRLKEHQGLLLNPEEGGKYLGYGYGTGLHASGEGYACGLHLMAVFADGKAAKCSFYSDQAVGSVQEGLRTCRERIEPIRLRDLQCACEYIEACRGGCRYRAELVSGKRGRDLYRCSLYGII